MLMTSCHVLNALKSFSSHTSSHTTHVLHCTWNFIRFILSSVLFCWRWMMANALPVANRQTHGSSVRSMTFVRSILLNKITLVFAITSKWMYAHCIYTHRMPKICSEMCAPVCHLWNPFWKCQFHAHTYTSRSYHHTHAHRSGFTHRTSEFRCQCENDTWNRNGLKWNELV